MENDLANETETAADEIDDGVARMWAWIPEWKGVLVRDMTREQQIQCLKDLKGRRAFTDKEWKELKQKHAFQD